MNTTQKLARIEEMESRLQGEFGNALDTRRNLPEAILLQDRIEELLKTLEVL